MTFVSPEMETFGDGGIACCPGELVRIGEEKKLEMIPNSVKLVVWAFACKIH